MERVKGFMVALEKDTTQEQADLLKVGISLMQKVLKVETIPENLTDDLFVEMRFKSSIRDKMISFIKENL